MRPIDWIVLVSTLLAIVAYGVWKGRRQARLAQYLLADRQLQWYTIALSVMATQASAITFLSTPGQAYTDGMRFVQFYLGLPIAMVILAITAVPIYHNLKVFTAYEYLETRFNLTMRVVTAFLFLIQRGLGTALTLVAPAIIVSLVLGWNLQLTTIAIGVLVIIYTTSGGTKAVSWTHTHQLLIALGGMGVALVVAIRSLPQNVGIIDAVRVAGRMGRINVIDFSFDLTTPYNFWSGIFGGLMVALAYFGTDQSQVQRYLTGETIQQSRLGLLFNGLVKVPMQFFILFVGAMVFVFYQFAVPPLSFDPTKVVKPELQTLHAQTFEAKRSAALRLVNAMDRKDARAIKSSTEELRVAQRRADETRRQVGANDTDYVFLTFIMNNLPPGLVGLLLAAIFCAAMSATASGLNSLASTTTVDVWKRLISRELTDHQYVIVSKWMTVFWGTFCIAFGLYATELGSLIVAVNRIGSLFYGTMLAIFLVAFYAKHVGGAAALCGAIVAEAAVILCWLFTDMAWLWWNVVGCVVGVTAALIAQTVMPKRVSS